VTWISEIHKQRTKSQPHPHYSVLDIQFRYQLMSCKRSLIPFYSQIRVCKSILNKHLSRLSQGENWCRPALFLLWIFGEYSFASVKEEALIHILFLKVEICSNMARFEVLRPMFMKNDVLVTTLYTNQHKHTVCQNHTNVLSEDIQTNRLLQTLWPDPATVNHTLTKLRQP
jgi:hypothetical protein